MSIAWTSDYAAGGSAGLHAIETELEPHLGRKLLEAAVERDSGRISDANHALEVRSDSSGVDHRLRSHCIDDALAFLVELLIAAHNESFGERRQLVSEGDSARHSGFSDRFQIDGLVVDAAARTEQGGVCAGSVETLVQRRDASGDELDL